MKGSNNSSHSSGRITRRKIIAAAGSASIVALAGCGGNGGSDGGGGNDGSNNDDSGGSSGDTSNSGPPKKPDSLLVRSWGGPFQAGLKNNVAEPFTEETGITIEFDNTDEDRLQGQIRTAINQDREPPVNVNWSTAPSSARSSAQELVVPLDTETVPSLTEMSSLAKPSVTDNDWPYVSTGAAVYTLSYNTDEISSEPASWEMWWEEKWQNSLGLYANGTGFTPIVAQLAGEQLDDDMSDTWDRYEEVAPNVGLIGGDTELTQNLRSGEIAMCTLIAANTVNAKDEGAPVEYTIPDEGAVAKREAMWVPKNQGDSETYWAQKFVDTAISAEHNGKLNGDIGVAPLNAEADVPEWMAEDKAFPTTQDQFDNLITTAPQKFIDHSQYWFSNFNKIMKS